MRVRWASLVASSLAACTFGTTSGAGGNSASIGDAGSGTDPGSDAASGVDATTPATGGGDDALTGPGSTAGDSTMGESTSGPTGGCPLGTEGCPCDAEVCLDGSVCWGDVCVAESCGDDVHDDWEECDDGNHVLGDGCDACVLSGGARALAAGDVHTCALLWDGGVRCWGDGGNGRLGYGDTDDVGDDEHPYEVANVPLGGAAVMVDAGSNFTCALLQTGRVRCWGEGGQGRLGTGETTDYGDNEPASDSPTVDLGGMAVQISVGREHACAVLGEGSVVCWGEGAQGRLGHGNQDDIGDGETPASVGPVDVGAKVTEVAAAGSHTCALLDTGGVKCWGNGAAGRLGYGNTDTIGDGGGETPAMLDEVPIGATVQHLAAGNGHTCVILVGGGMRCWGVNASGQLGYGGGGNLGDMPDETPDMLGDIPLPGPVAAMGLGNDHTCAALEDGSLWCWGSGADGRLGYGSTDNVLAPAAAPVEVSATQATLAIAGGLGHTCARLDLGNVRCWGLNAAGQLGYAHTETIAEEAGETPESAGDVLFLPP